MYEFPITHVAYVIYIKWIFIVILLTSYIKINLFKILIIIQNFYEIEIWHSSSYLVALPTIETKAIKRQKQI